MKRADEVLGVKKVIREWAEVPYVPTRQYERKDSQPYRYLAIRLRRQQGELLEDGANSPAETLPIVNANKTTVAHAYLSDPSFSPSLTLPHGAPILDYAVSRRATVLKIVTDDKLSPATAANAVAAPTVAVANPLDCFS